MALSSGLGRISLVAGALGVALICGTALLQPWPTALCLAAALALFALPARELAMSRHRLVEEHAAHLAKSMYLANMSHELRTPLNAIIGFSDLMTGTGTATIEPAKCREYARDIHGCAQHLLDLINDVLEMSRIEAGRLELRRQPTEIAPLLLSCQRMLREKARQTGAELVFSIDGTMPPVLCDAAKLKQIVLNLAGNALKFTPAGGRVTVEAGIDAGDFVLSVTDTGIGIAEADIPRVLTPFVQAAHCSLGSAEGGTGLGLPLSKRLAELHGGALSLASRLGHGTRVTVTLPTERQAAPRPAPVFEPQTFVTSTP